MSTARDAAFACLVAEQHGVFTPRQASEAGFNRKALRHRVTIGRWRRRGRRVLVLAGTPDTPEQRRWAALLDAGDLSALSHDTAAVIRGVPGYRERVVNVTKHESRHHSLELGRLHCNARLPPSHVQLIEGLPVTTIARTIFDLAGDPEPHVWRNPKLLEIHKQRVARALDTSLARLGNTIEEQLKVNAELVRRGRPGSKIMRELLDERTGAGWAPTESDLEDLFLAVCETYAIEPPVRQRDLGSDRERRVDFVYFNAKLIIELDGRPFHESLSDSEEDRWRDIEMGAMGFTVMRFRWHDLVHRPDRVARSIQRALRVAAA
jgi:hypothetical protein